MENNVKEKNNSKGVIILLCIIIVVLLALCTLFATDTISLNNKQTSNNITQQEENSDNNDTTQIDNNGTNKDNLTIIIDDNPNAENKYTKTIQTNKGDKILYVSDKEIKLDDKEILKLDDGAEYLQQVTVYKDLIITEQLFSLSPSMIIYDFDGNILKNITLFSDEQGRIFHMYLHYKENEPFNVSDNGIISFVGTKHLQGAVNTYIDNNEATIDLCTQGENIDENEIVSGIFKMTYLGNYSFSNITYVSTKTTVKDIKSCN